MKLAIIVAIALALPGCASTSGTNAPTKRSEPATSPAPVPRVDRAAYETAYLATLGYCVIQNPAERPDYQQLRSRARVLVAASDDHPDELAVAGDRPLTYLQARAVAYTSLETCAPAAARRLLGGAARP